MIRRFILAVCLLGNIAVSEERPDILMFVVDDMNDWISLLDPESPIETPNLERLAARGTLFTRAYCASPACNPSRAATLTGLRPTTTGVYGNKSDWRGATPGRKTFLERFRDEGWRVEGAGKIFHHHLDGAFHDERSFDDFQPMREQLYPDEKLNQAPEYGSPNTDWGVWPPDEKDSIDFATAEYCMEALRSSPDDQPLFLACGIFKPHSPFFAPRKYHDLVGDVGLPLRNEDDWNDLPAGAEDLMAKKKWFWNGMMDLDEKIPGSYGDFIQAYAACCRFADDQIGRVLDALDESPRGRDTIIVLWSDHGFHLGEKDHIEKFALWEKANRIPFLVVAPGVTESGSRCDTPVDLSALYQTLLELAGLPSDPECDGVSVVPLLENPNTDWDRPALMTYGRGNHAVRSERWRYIRYADGTEELYDHETDPNEWTNLATDPELASVIATHQEWLPKKEAKKVPDLKAKPSAATKPNVLFLAVDDMNDWVNCLGGYGGTVQTPNIDRLAERGVLFTNAHCPSPKCAPSRAAILTGLRPSTTGLYENNQWWYPIYPDTPTIPIHFRKNGYRAVGAGKIFHHTAGNHPPNQWDDFLPIRFRNDPWFRESRVNYPWSESGPPPNGFPFSGVDGLGHENDWGSLEISEGDYDDTHSADFAVEFLGKKPSVPFFLACGLFRPHLPWYVPKKYFDLYPLEEIVLPEVPNNDLDDVPEPGQKLARDRQSDFEAIRDSGKWREAVRAYLASISYADAQVGRVLDALDSSPAVDDTIVILWSDHGWHLGEKQHWHKTTLWEEATRVPLIVAGPGIEPGRCDRSVNLIDLFPTLIDLCGLKKIEGLDGSSLVPLLKKPGQLWEQPSVIEYKVGNAAVRSERWRYIRYKDGSEELYDHSTDPNEWENVVDEEKFKAVKNRLAKFLPGNWAEPAPAKGAFEFDPDTFSWTEKKSGRLIEAAKPTIKPVDGSRAF